MTDISATGPHCVAALDLGGTHVRTAVVTVNGEVIGRRHARSDVALGAEAVVEQCARSLRQSIDEHLAAGGAAPIALGVSSPGPLDPTRGVLFDPPNLDASFRDFPLAERLASATGLPCRVERDTQVAALGEGRFGAARGLADYLYLTVSTGVGGAVVSDGRLLRGERGLAGELGHLLVDADGPMCGCGARGHLEAICSGTGIARAASEVLGRPMTAAEVAAAEDAGDALAAKVMDYARRSFAAACVSLVDIFAPRRIVVGGGVAMGQGERLLAPAREAVNRFAFREQAAQVEIVAAALGDDVGLLGAVPLLEDAGLLGAG
jgi:glucokinase